MAQLNADPEFVKRRADRDAALEKWSKRLRTEEEPLLADLRKVGWEVTSAWELVKTSTPYPEALPVLLSHLSRPYSTRIREGIARAMAVRDACIYWSTLRDLFTREKEKEVRDALAVVLSAASNGSLITQLAELAKDPANGSSRLLLLRGLRRSKSPTARETLAELANDPALAKEISSWRKE
ncbi:MAG: hypothetical protein JSS87_08910 [Acidobacteria bacterium]|nr:hypothetical protein [Acidobacteriota bacterium]